MRLFVALDLPWPLREQLETLGQGLSGARWVGIDNLHLTLRFIGETQPHLADEIDLVLGSLRAKRFELSLTGLGVHDKLGRPSALWVGVERNDRLDHLRAKIETALQRAGLPAEKRRFLPHVTIAKLDGQVVEAKLAAYIQQRNLFRAAPVAIQNFSLFSSLRGKEQAVYTNEVEYPLE